MENEIYIDVIDYVKLSREYVKICKFKEYITDKFPNFDMGGVNIKYKFPNGYGVSMLTGHNAFGGCELVKIEKNGKINDNVIGNLHTNNDRFNALQNIFDLSI